MNERTAQVVERELEAARWLFLVRNWPGDLQKTSVIERRLVTMMPTMAYRLVVDQDENGAKAIRIRTTDPESLPSTVLHYAKKYERELIAWVEQTARIRATIERLETELCQIHHSPTTSEANDSPPA